MDDWEIDMLCVGVLIAAITFIILSGAIDWYVYNRKGKHKRKW